MGIGPCGYFLHSPGHIQLSASDIEFFTIPSHRITVITLDHRMDQPICPLRSGRACFPQPWSEEATARSAILAIVKAFHHLKEVSLGGVCFSSLDTQ